MISDEAAYRQYLDGDESAAETLVARYGDALTLFLNGYLKDMHESEDLMIEAFACIFAKERPIGADGSFRAYLYRTARNLALRHCRKHRIAFLHFEELPFEPPSEALADTPLVPQRAQPSALRSAGTASGGIPRGALPRLL